MFCLSDQTPTIGANEMQSAKKKIANAKFSQQAAQFFHLQIIWFVFSLFG